MLLLNGAEYTKLKTVHFIDPFSDANQAGQEL